MSETVIDEARLTETRAYPAPAGLAAQANVGAEAYDRAAADPVAFWEEAARRLDWAETWHTAHEWQPPQPGADGALSVPAARWFVGGRSTSRTTASTATSRRAAATRSRFTSRASPATASP